MNFTFKSDSLADINHALEVGRWQNRGGHPNSKNEPRNPRPMQEGDNIFLTPIKRLGNVVYEGRITSIQPPDPQYKWPSGAGFPSRVFQVIWIRTWTKQELACLLGKERTDASKINSPLQSGYSKGW